MTKCKNCGHKIVKRKLKDLEYWSHIGMGYGGFNYLSSHCDDCGNKCDCTNPEPKRKTGVQPKKQ